MSGWNSYNSSKFQVERFFRSGKLSQSQMDNQLKIVEVMRKYLLIDGNILEARAGEKIGLSHIKRAIDLDLIVELKDFKALNSNFEVEGNHYFYTLGFAGINYLRVANIEHNCFNIADTFEDKQKVLMFNYQALENDHTFLFSKYNDMKKYNFFHCKDSNNKNVILYFDDYININHIKAIMKKKYSSTLSKEKLEDLHELFGKFIANFRFETIKFRNSSFNADLKNTIYTKHKNINKSQIKNKFKSNEF